MNGCNHPELKVAGSRGNRNTYPLSEANRHLVLSIVYIRLRIILSYDVLSMLSRRQIADEIADITEDARQP